VRLPSLVLMLLLAIIVMASMFCHTAEAPVAESSAIIFEEGELVEWEAAPIYYDWNGDLITTKQP